MYQEERERVRTRLIENLPSSESTEPKLDNRTEVRIKKVTRECRHCWNPEKKPTSIFEFFKKPTSIFLSFLTNPVKPTN